MAKKKISKETHNFFIVKEETTLLEFVMKCLEGISKNKAKSILTNQGVTVNKAIQSKHDFKLFPGMQVAISKHKRSRVLHNPYVSIVYEDAWIVVVHKAPGILSMNSNPTKMSVKKVLDDYYQSLKKNFHVHVVHRLDRDTSGLMIYAKSMDVRKQLEENWSNLIVDRRYGVIVEGDLEQNHQIIETYLQETKDMKVVSSPTNNGGKLAVTEFWKVKSNDTYSLLDVKLHTGRKNQIRVHMLSINHPVVGDLKYGSTLNPINRLALHAYLLDFYHPVTKELLTFECPLPPSFQTILGK